MSVYSIGVIHVNQVILKIIAEIKKKKKNCCHKQTSTNQHYLIAEVKKGATFWLEGSQIHIINLYCFAATRLHNTGNRRWPLKTKMAKERPQKPSIQSTPNDKAAEDLYKH